MQTIKKLSDLEPALAPWRSAEGGVALVPTMGALHDGHLALIAEARRRAARVAATIFVNPLQFNDAADLERYPRTVELDLAKLASAGCDLVWLPTAEAVYPPGFATTVSVGGLSQRWEGEHRPGHFDGVATVVAKLLIAIRPDVALFGEKDWQQLAVIRRMVADLALSVQVLGVPTVREADGLALSSRNIHLSVEERQRALALPSALQQARNAILGGQPAATALAEARQALAAAGFAPVDYVALVDAATLEPVEEPGGPMRLIAAATLGATRLIDNIAVEMEHAG
jgi:pantoate--beta-alanine ligase